MPRTVKIKEGDTIDKVNSSTADHIARTERQRDRETANKIKEWVGELQDRKRALRLSASSLIRSFESAQR